jgi:Kef-type K+ transport system membrane component KefB
MAAGAPGMTVQDVENAVVATLVELVVIVLVARLGGVLARKAGQPRAVGEIVAGLALGPSLLGWIAPDVSAFIFNPAASLPLVIISQIGLLLLMFQIGSDFEFSLLARRDNRRAVVAVTLASVLAPLACGFALGWLTAPLLAPGIAPLPYALFMAVALAITAVPILGRILKEFGLTRSPPGVIAIAAAAGNDVIGWVLLAAVGAYASTGFSAAGTGWQLAGLVGLLIGLWLMRPVVNALVARLRDADGGPDNTAVAIVLALIFLGGMATEALGIFTIFGGFLVGLLFHPHREFAEGWNHKVGQFVLVFFLPIFFTYTGLRTNILGLDTWADWGWCALILFVAVAAKIGPVWLAARMVGVPGPQALVLGTLMNTRALMELIVLNIGYSLGVIPQDVFTMLVIMAVVTTIMTGPLLKRLLPRAGLMPERLQEA